MKKFFVALLIVALSSGIASASLIEPNVVKNKREMSLGFSIFQGFGLVGTGTFAIDNRMAVGGSMGFSFGGASSILGDLHLNFQFLEPTAKTPMSVSLIGGVWGGTSSGIWLSSGSREFYIAPEIGLAVSYMFDSRLTGRFNLVYGPSLGIELGYKITPAFEAIFAISEQVIGIKFRF